MAYLLAAEADKIQDFIFRSARLREVVGASQLLSRFCNEAIKPLREKYGVTAEQILVNDGGSFRIEFTGNDDQETCRRAKQFGAELAELYRLALGGSLSVAEPVKVNGNFTDANKEAGKKLRQAKKHHSLAAADPHMPYVAYCASCGVGLANRHGHLGKEPSGERGRFLCPTCQGKDWERNHNRENLLDEWLRLVLSAEEKPEEFEWADDADSVAGHDPRARNYVAYLVADGNGMGKIFGKCDREALHKLSIELPRVVKGALAEAAKPLRKNLAIAHPQLVREVPALPLILGGDDVFVLLPAPYALDFARRFCLAFEQGMAQVVNELQLPVRKPTMAAAVVICKSKYPYALAHRRGEELLNEAKRMCKRLAAQCDEALSAVNFEVILGNRLAGQVEADENRTIQPSLKPYWVTEEGGSLSANALAYSLPLKALLDQRLALKDVPNKRLHEVRTAFAEVATDKRASERDAYLARWEEARKRPFQRSGFGAELWAAMAALGRSPDKEAEQAVRHHWRETKRGNERPLAHGLPDLLEVWDFAQDLCRQLDEYEPKEKAE